MATGSQKAQQLIALLDSVKTYEQILEELKAKDISEDDKKISIPGPINWSANAQQERLDFLKEKTNIALPYLSGKKVYTDVEDLRGNIEQYIGMTQVPTGIIGPALIHGTVAQGDFYIPLATTEGALIASYNRGARATRLCGGITSVCLTESVQRTPLFKFRNLSEVGTFMKWILNEVQNFQTWKAIK